MKSNSTICTKCLRLDEEIARVKFFDVCKRSLEKLSDEVSLFGEGMFHQMMMIYLRYQQSEKMRRLVFSETTIFKISCSKCKGWKSSKKMMFCRELNKKARDGK